jgi:tetratricopeptide (TPR) repeat protein
MTGRVEPFELPPDHVVAEVIRRADTAFAGKDANGLDKAYRSAVRLSNGYDGLRTALRLDHAARLHALGASTLALASCEEHLRAEPANCLLLLLRAEIRGSVGDHAGAGADTAEVRSRIGAPANVLADDDHARLLRIEGLAAADRGDLGTAMTLLTEAARRFRIAGNQQGAATVDRDRFQVTLPPGAMPIDGDLVPNRPRTVADHLLLAMVLKRRLRYEEALVVVLRAATGLDVAPAMRLPVLAELVVLLHMTRQGEAAARFGPLLAEAAADWPDPVAAGELLARLSPNAPANAPLSPRADHAIQHARRLVEDGRLDEAEHLLVRGVERTRTERDICAWHLAAGELEEARYLRRQPRSHLDQALAHLDRAARHAGEAALFEVQAVALRRLGDCWSELHAEDQAVRCWAEAHRLEERTANLQLSDFVRVGMLRSAEDEHDGRIRAAVRAFERDGADGAAGIVVALEAARGATMLDSLVPGEGVTRELPPMGDLDGAKRWLREITRDVPRSQLIWIMHATPDRLHHAVVGAGVLLYTSTRGDLYRLEDAIIQLNAYCSHPDTLERSIATGDFDEQLEVITAELGIGEMIHAIPQRVHRIAIMAAGMLSDIPFSALVPAGAAERVGRRFALSELPCLASFRPLRLRSLRQRGHDSLLASPPDDKLTEATERTRLTLLRDDNATPERLRNALRSNRHHLIRIDSHGVYDPDDGMESWLQLAPDGHAGLLSADRLGRMDLSRCGTLVLGACESGMAQARGRDERIGFARAAMNAGTASVVAAKWVAEDSAAADVLDRFERHLGYLPRDLALQRAQLEASDKPGREHPAFWSCWTLFGDAGFQTSRGPIRRAFVKWRDHAANR